MATITNISTSFYKYHDHSSSKTLLPVPKLALPFALNPLKPSYSHRVSKNASLFCSAVLNSTPGDFSPHDPKEPRGGSDILVESLERQGVETVFTYRGSVSKRGVERSFAYLGDLSSGSTELYHALKSSSVIRRIVSRNGRSALFAAEGYARSSGKPGICILAASSDYHHLADYLTTCLAADTCVPLVAITSQYLRDEMSTRLNTKRIFQVMNGEDIPKIIEEALFLAASGRPGLILIIFPQDIHKYYAVPSWESYWDQILSLIKESKKPMLHVGGGCLNSIDELNRFVQLTGIPVTSAMMGLGSYPSNDDFSLQLFGMRRTVYANHALETCDLLLAFGVGPDEPLPGNAKTVHIDIDAPGSMERPLVPVRVDVKLALQEMNKILEEGADELNLDFKLWRNELEEYKQHTPLSFKPPEEAIPPQYVIQVLNELTDGNAFISTGVGQLQMWASQFYKCKKPMHWLASRGFEAMGFGLSAATGASVANPNEVVVYIDGDRSFLKNVPHLHTIATENLPVKIVLLDYEYIGVSMAGEIVYKKSFLDDKATILPDMLKVAEICKIPGRRVSRREEVGGAIQIMLETPGPYMLDVIVLREREILGRNTKAIN